VTRHSNRHGGAGLILATVAGWILVTGCTPTGSFKITAVPEDQTLQEKIVYRDPGWVSDRVALIDIGGVLMNAYEPKLLGEGEHVVGLAVEKLNTAANDKRVKAIVLRINSPGGSVTASDILYEEIKAFKKKTGKPVVAYFQDVAASGGYYLACAADEILAERTCITGSIGVIMQMVDFTGTMAKLGIGADAITSGAYKDAGSPLRRMRPEERELFQKLVDGMYQQFVDVVAAGRPKLTREQILALADGRVYSAQQALDAGLVDRISTLEEAINAAKKRAGIKASLTVVYHRPLEWRGNIYAQSPVTGSQTVNLVNIDLPADWTKRPRFMYIWSVEE
jgi:protease IV